MSPNPHTRALDARRRLIGQLRRSDLPGTTALAAVLKTCTTSDPCGSAACPVCGLDFQVDAVSVVDRSIGEPARAIRGRKTAVTIVPASGIVIPPEELTAEAFERVGDEIEAALARLGLPPAIFGVEVSFNEDTTGRDEDHWSIHGHGNGLGWLSEAEKKALRAAFPPSRLVRRPVFSEPLDENVRGRKYPFKPERYLRLTELKTDRQTGRSYRDTKHRNLRPWQAVSLALVDDEVGFHGRLRTHAIDDGAVRRHLEGCGWPRDGP